MSATHEGDSHHEAVDVTRASRRPHVLMVVANPTTSSTTGWPVGSWAAELFHPLFEFTKARYRVTVGSPDGGRVEVDALSDPRDEDFGDAAVCQRVMPFRIEDEARARGANLCKRACSRRSRFATTS